MDGQQIIMNHTISPTLEDIEVMVGAVLDDLPDELMSFCDGLAVRIEDFPDELVEGELELDDPYDLLALYRSGKEISPGVEKKTANDGDLLIIFRRPLLDMWCETGEDITALVRRAIIDELGNHFDFSEDEVHEMTVRHYQGML